MVTVVNFAGVFPKATFGPGKRAVLVLSLAFQAIAIRSVGWVTAGVNSARRGIPDAGNLDPRSRTDGVAERDCAPAAIAVSLGLVLGSSQSLLRSMFSRMLPRDHSGKFLGIHALVGRASASLEPMVFELVSATAGSQRMATVSIGLFLLVGAVLLAKVPNVLMGDR
jgi:UMF1 family MFS transporter